jgi:hypothetical protein
MIASIVVGAVVAICLLTCCCLPLRRRKLMKRDKDMPPLEVSQAEQELEFQRQLDEEYKRTQLEEIEQRNSPPVSPPRVKNMEKDDNKTEEVALMPLTRVKRLVTVFDNTLV